MFSYQFGIILVLLFSWSFSVFCWPVFHLYTRKNPTQYTLVTDLLKGTNFVSTLETKFLVHGFGGQGDNDAFVNIKDELLKKENVNVICIDWKEGAASPNYFSAVKNVRIAGEKTASFIVSNLINPKKVHCIGHSLGSHVCGFIGKKVKLRRITGLDPAGPSFKGTASTERLDKTDADFVDNIHTDSTYGIQDAIGHKDFYPNGGAKQAGCTTLYSPNNTVRGQLTSVIACSHLRVPMLYSESVNSACQFQSVKCGSLTDYNTNKCSCSLNGCSSMGHNADKTTTVGSYFLFTGSSSPFCKS